MNTFLGGFKPKAGLELNAFIRDRTGFDGDFYLLSNPDVKAAGMDGLTHYLNHGFKEGRLPRADISIADLTDIYVDMAGAEGLNRSDYLAGVVAAVAKLLPQALSLPENAEVLASLRQSPAFSAEYYATQIGAATTLMEPVIHYVLIGRARGLKPAPLPN